MKKIGVIEGFFGPQWPMHSRLGYAKFLESYGGNFYIYAPKQDPHLRKNWREEWGPEYLEHLRTLIDTFHASRVQFGVGFSPFGLGNILTEVDKEILVSKLNQMNDLGIDVLGLFFDDMPITENLAKNQIEVLSLIQKHFDKKIIFCPSYYTPDPILDKVFGQRPKNYLVDIANGVPPEVEIAWTGPKVISPVIDKDHLQETTALLKRKPFIWENLFANDGPKNCKFLKIRPFTGRNEQTLLMSEGIGLNLMNQPELSKILYLSARDVLKGTAPEEAFERALETLCSSEFRLFLKNKAEKLLATGLDNLSHDEKTQWKKELGNFPDSAAREISDWLDGQYNVGSECLTD